VCALLLHVEHYNMFRPVWAIIRLLPGFTSLPIIITQQDASHPLNMEFSLVLACRSGSETPRSSELYTDPTSCVPRGPLTVSWGCSLCQAGSMIQPHTKLHSARVASLPGMMHCGKRSRWSCYLAANQQARPLCRTIHEMVQRSRSASQQSHIASSLK
jgi:hypothetical protein